jgi:hypothetical protein
LGSGRFLGAFFGLQLSATLRFDLRRGFLFWCFGSGLNRFDVLDVF